MFHTYFDAFYIIFHMHIKSFLTILVVFVVIYYHFCHLFSVLLPFLSVLKFFLTIIIVFQVFSYHFCRLLSVFLSILSFFKCFLTVIGVLLMFSYWRGQVLKIIIRVPGYLPKYFVRFISPISLLFCVYVCVIFVVY